MHRRAVLLAAAASLVAISQASIIPAKDISVVSRSIELLPPDTDLTIRNWTRFDLTNGRDLSTSLSSSPHELVAIPHTAVVIAVVYTSAQVVSAVCAIAATTGPAGVAVCGVVAMTVVLTNFFTIFRASSGPAGTENPALLLHAGFQPAAGCDTVCQLRTNIAESTWTSVGNITVDGTLHDVHFSQNGNILGLRAVSGTLAKTKRDDIDDDHGVVASYFWEDDNQKAWKDFNRGAIGTMADDAAAFIVSNKAPIICANLLDQDGAVDAGILTIDAGNAELALAGDSYNNALAFCLAGDPKAQ